MAKKTTRKSKRPRLLGWLGYGLVCLAALVGGSLFGWVGQSSFAREMFLQRLYGTEPQDIWNGRDKITLLILGCDEDRTPGGKRITRERARSDMMLVTRLDFANNRISGLSIPRDTLAAPKGYRSQKINAYHSIGGPTLSRKAVEALLPGVKIDRVVVLDFEAFAGMVDLVGGVELNVPRRMVYKDRAGGLHIDLKPGVQTLDGDRAVGFVRYRKGDDDFHRQDRQKEFMIAFKSAVMKRPGQLPRVAQKAREVFGGALSDQEVASLALFAKSVGNQSIHLGTLPTVPASNYNLRVDRSARDKTLREFGLIEQAPMRVSSTR